MTAPSINAFLAIEEVATELHPEIFVEAKDKGTASEQKRQTVLKNKLAKLPGIVMWTAPNEGRKTEWERIARWQAGARKGAPDLTVMWNRGVACIEMKSGTGSLEKPQIEMLNQIKGLHHHVAVCRTAEGALGWLASIGAPVPGSSPRVDPAKLCLEGER